MAGMQFAVSMQRESDDCARGELYTDSCLGLIPFLGYHHVLMILIALAIILLCE
jgi:hypothetical protein